MALPKQIRNQIKQNEELEKALREEQSDPKKEAEDSAQAEIDALLNEIDPAAEKKAEEAQPKEEPKEKPTAEVHELRPSDDKAERTDWKVKYSTLKGKYDAEVPRLTQDLREANSRIQNLEDRLAELATAKAAPEEQSTDSRIDFTPDEIADYGEDLLDVIGRKARSIVEHEYRPKIDALESQVSTLKSQLGETGQRVGKFEQNEVFAVLDREVKDWRQTNVDPEFHEWLDQQDPFSGESRKSLLLKAFDRKNAQQVKAFFESYAKEHAAVAPSSADSAPSGQGGTDSESRLNLNDYVAPGQPKGGQGSAGAPKDKRIWRSAEISKFYSDVQKGRFKGRPEDKARIEADIVAATSEGRIQS
jgi:hypothetical protein